MGDDNVIPFPGVGPSEDDDVRAWAKDLIDQLGSPQAAIAALSAFGALDDGYARFGRRPPVLLPRRPKRAAYVVRVDLDHSKPVIWRRLRLASDLTLPQVHDLLQVAMGWTDSHLHHFVMGPKTKDLTAEPFLNPFDVDEGEEGIPESDVSLDEVLGVPGDRLFYEYDFGDAWHHTIKLESVEVWSEGDPLCVCLAGRRACPPEDVGGLGGYEEVLDALAGRIAPEDAEWMAEKLEWMPPDFDPAAFSVEETNALLSTAPLPDLDAWHPAIADLLAKAGGSAMSPVADLVKRALQPTASLTEDETAAAVRRYRHLIDTVGKGLKLTAAGYLPPRIVEAMYRDLGMDTGWWGKGNREDLTLPVLWLRESATKLGLLRKNRGYLLPTKIGTRLAHDAAGLFSHVASKLPLGRPHERDAGVLALLLVASRTPWTGFSPEAADLMAWIGWHTDGNLERAVYQWARPTMDVFDQLVDEEASVENRARVAQALLSRT